MSAHPIAASRSAVQWAWIRHAGGRAAIVAVLMLGVRLWIDSTRPHDPLRPGPGLGIDGSGVRDVAVGQGRGFSFVLVGRTPGSHATITGYTLPHLPGVRLRMVAIGGAFHGSFIGFPVTAHPSPPSPGTEDFRPLVGARLITLPARLHWPGPVLTAALVVTPLTRGCHRITGVSIHYRVGDTTFTRSMDGAISVATGNDFCM